MLSDDYQGLSVRVCRDGEMGVNIWEGRESVALVRGIRVGWREILKQGKKMRLQSTSFLDNGAAE